MAGYSGTPLPRKLGIREGHRVAFFDAPAEFDAALGELPEGVAPLRDPRGRGPFDVIVWFTRERRHLERRLPELAARLDPAGGLWIAWPKKASGVATDVTEGVVRELGLATGLVDNKVCAVDAVWSGLRFVHRLTDRPAKAKPAKAKPAKAKPARRK